MDSPKHELDLEEIRALVRIASEADITELAVESPTLKVKIKKRGARRQTGAQRNPATARSAPPADVTARGGLDLGEDRMDLVPLEEAEGTLVPDYLKPITAPMVGTFYRAASPDAPPFVEEGEVIEAGQTVCIIEAMKLFNEIQSDVAGRVASIVVENGAPVEYGQPLLLIEPLDDES